MAQRARAKRMRFALDFPEQNIASAEREMIARGPGIISTTRKFLPPGYLQRGYNGSKYWPFSIKKAVREIGYRRGVRRAIVDKDFHPAWRHFAIRYMWLVRDILSGKLVEFEQALEPNE